MNESEFWFYKNFLLFLIPLFISNQFVQKSINIYFM